MFPPPPEKFLPAKRRPAILPILGVLLAGCAPSRLPAPVPPAPVPPASIARQPDTPSVHAAAEPDGKRVPANEAGLIPILEYHRIVSKPGPYDRSPAAFRRDLERLYREGYLPVLLQNLLRGEIALPAGTSPVVLTFDDADASQFRYLPDGTLDPDCAVAILQAFARRHPDFLSKATFYVLPESAFGPAKDRAKKLRVLRDEMHCEIGNHTITHRSLRKLSDAEVQREIGGAVEKIHQLLPGTAVESIALPMGISPRNRALLAAGSFQGQAYANRAVLLVGANPAPSPFTRDFAPLRLPRIQAVEGPMGITYWLEWLKTPGRRYVADGDPGTVTVPKSKAKSVDAQRRGGRALQTY